MRLLSMLLLSCMFVHSLSLGSLGHPPRKIVKSRGALRGARARECVHCFPHHYHSNAALDTNALQSEIRTIVSLLTLFWVEYNISRYTDFISTFVRSLDAPLVLRVLLYANVYFLKTRAATTPLLPDERSQRSLVHLRELHTAGCTG